MEAGLEVAASLLIKYAPELVEDVKAAFVKAGYTVAQVEAIFANVKPWEQLGINPNAPVALGASNITQA